MIGKSAITLLSLSQALQVVVVLVGEIQIHLPESRSLKDKRQVVKSLKERIRSRFNVSVAEVDFNDMWQRSSVGIAVVTSAMNHAEEVMSKVIDFVERDGRAQVLDVHIEDR